MRKVIGWAMLGYAKKSVDHYWFRPIDGVAESLCGQICSGSYLYTDGVSGLPHCKRCTKALEKKNG